MSQERPSSSPTREALIKAGRRLDAFERGLSRSERAALHELLRRAGGPGAQLAPAELAEYRRLCAEPDPPPGDRAAVTMIMKATRLCNLRCTYCHSWRSGPNQRMSFAVLARAVRDTLRDPAIRSAEFVWHGGEPTLLPTSFYATALWLQRQFQRPGQRVSNSIQTNGTRLSEEWVTFARDHDIGIGVSLDGPPEIHDTRRVDIAGRPTSAQVREGLRRLKAAGIPRTGTLMVVDDAVCDLGAQRVLEYLLEIEVDGVALLNVLPENTAADNPQQGAYLAFDRFVAFLQEMFSAWWPVHSSRIHIRELDALVRQVQGAGPQVCVFAGDCFGTYLTVEPTGEVSACDKYIDDDYYRFGHVLGDGLPAARQSARLARVREENRARVSDMRGCRWFSACHGGCPHDLYTAQRRLGRVECGCCGLAPLMEDIARGLGAEDAPPATARPGISSLTDVIITTTTKEASNA